MTVRALFQQRIAGDDALLRLAALRFAEAGMPAEVYADHPDDLERLLCYIPEHETAPVVHLSRSADLLTDAGRNTVEAFASRFSGRVAGLVVHDKATMRDRTGEVVAALRQLGRPRRGRPMVFLEYATGLGPPWYVELAERIADVEGASVCRTSADRPDCRNPLLRRRYSGKLSTGAPRGVVCRGSQGGWATDRSASRCSRRSCWPRWASSRWPGPGSLL